MRLGLRQWGIAGPLQASSYEKYKERKKEKKKEKKKERLLMWNKFYISAHCILPMQWFLVRLKANYKLGYLLGNQKNISKKERKRNARFNQNLWKKPRFFDWFKLIFEMFFIIRAVPVMVAVAVRKKVVNIGHFSPSFYLQSLQIFLFVKSNQK